MKTEIHKQPLKITKKIKDSDSIYRIKGVKFTRIQKEIMVKLVTVAFILGLMIGLII